jgi:hypothetical protein
VADRAARIERVKALGRVAYRHLRQADIAGVITVEGEEKYLRQRDEGSLCIDLLEPHPRSTDPTDFSELELRAHGRKVLVIRWDSTGFFKAVTYEPGPWERELLDWPDPVPFD